MIDLDDARAVRAADPGGMLEAVVSLPRHCREGWELGTGAADLPAAEGVSAVAFCGMGGSAVAGDVMRTLYADRLPVPLTVVRSPQLPASCGPDTLVIVSSYSGDTAETLACFEEAVARRCRIVAVTSGGRLARRATELQTGLVRVPGGFMPRAALGYLALGTLGALEAMGTIAPLRAELDEAVREMERLLDAIGPRVREGSNPAKALARRIGEQVPVIWGAEGIGAVAAARWKTQLNENAKVPAFAAALPELDHNEVVGWSEGRGAGFVLVALRHAGEHPQVAPRFPLSEELARASGLEAEEVWAVGDSALARLFTLIQHGDLVSTYLGLARGVDPTPIDAIARLKRALAET
ncbi:MAG TPA: bifunctional phosphoglucose/phosphomannose isomerase [Actinomycetota bacterium]|nr:bifunctional phosphoglucose/phosphomannose isomerase [Actinomycetota bacterium]